MKTSLLWSLSALCCCASLMLLVSCSSQTEPKTAPVGIDVVSSPTPPQEPTSELMAASEPAPMEEPTMELAPLDQEELVFESSTPISPQTSLQSTPPAVAFEGPTVAESGGSKSIPVPMGFTGDSRVMVESPQIGMVGRGKAARASEVAQGGTNAGLMQPYGGGGMGGGGGFFGGSGKVSSELPRGAQADPFAPEHEQTEPSNREAYDSIVESPFKQVSDHPLSTFSIDVDTASYSNMRRFLSAGQFPPAGAVRIEELVNYFTYNYPQPKGDEPFAADVEIAAAPWNEKHRLVRVGIQGRKIEAELRPACNLVFLIDTSGSMQDANKLPLVAQSMLLLAENLNEKDHVAIVTYAGSAGVLLPATAGNEHAIINGAINSLRSGGSTNGAGGIRMAYEIARGNFIKEGVNRVILATDGDFNVGTTNQSELVSLIEEEAKSGVFLSVLGYGMGNYNDSTLEKLADKGNGNYAYIDTINEGRKVLGEQMLGTLVTIAKDVKIQIEFNPALVAAYRLIGYENRILQKEDFNDDKKDAGEIGAGHTVTAPYEIVPVGVAVPAASVDPLKYQKTDQKLSKAAKSDELFTLKLRHKEPASEKSKLMEFPVKDEDRKFVQASKDFQFAASVASFGMVLRQSKHSGDMSLDGILEIASSAKGEDPSGYRAEFVELVQKAKEMQK